jgi:hypothetical protein
VQQAHPHSREIFASAAAWLICAAATIATITGAYAWSALCQDGTFDRCPNGNPLFASWALFLDAATHGWNDLKLLWLG